MARRDTRMFNANRFKLGLFAPNCRGGLSLTRGPERWDATWENNLTAAQLAEEAGLEFVLPLARWSGHPGATEPGACLETLMWAGGMLAGTREICVFATIHVPLINPILLAKQAVTADLIGRGRFGLNIVSGWNEAEFAMFGVPFLEHDERYAYSEEWYQIVRRIWAEDEPFDFKGRFFDLKGVVGHPKPFEGVRPLVISAGSSKAGRAFAARNVDCLFMLVMDPAKLKDEITQIRSAPETAKTGVFASGHLICRPTEREARDFYRHVVDEMGDWAAMEHVIKARQTGQSIPPDKLREMQDRLISGTGTLPVIGDPDQVARQFLQLSEAGLDGMAIGLIDYIDEMPLIRDEVLPRMKCLGLRT